MRGNFKEFSRTRKRKRAVRFASGAQAINHEKVLISYEFREGGG